MSSTKCFLSPPGVVTAQGCSREELASRFFADVPLLPLTVCNGAPSGIVHGELPTIADKKFDTRANRLMLACLKQIAEHIEFVKKEFGAERIGVVIGNSNAAILEAESEMRDYVASEGKTRLSPQYLDLGNQAEFAKRELGIGGPAYAVSTACSSAGKAFASAKRLIATGMCDAVVVGGTDSFAPFVQAGFESLGLISKKVSSPLSAERDGINVGEGAAMFVASKVPFPESEEILVLGVGESSDAYHLTSPEPEGKGAEAAMREALADAGLSPEEIDYINLHGTGTQDNDAMESHAVATVFGEKIPPCSSTKPFLGHALGASGALEAALCWLALSGKYNPQNVLPQHPEIGSVDRACEMIPLVKKGQVAERIATCLSNSFAFGGSNVSVILGKKR
ncbi:MAG: beta-ketoacyl-ACP synthase [Oscillospiraceae bacterium]|nr:beta-ketoacyl-ACP synthase [Oscillospiraceae bacterium]